MADGGEGGSSLPKIPGLDGKNKKIVIGVAAAAALFVGWKYWSARQTSDGESTISDGEFGAVDSSIPGVLGAVSPTNSYGSDTGSTADESDTSSFTTNSQWTTYARSQLSGTYDDAAILEALGNYLNARPASTDQQKLIRAAIAVAGYPPVSGYALISGGDTAISVAPTGLKPTVLRDDHITMGWNAVAGASGYRLYGAGGSVNTSTAAGTISGLKPGTSYTFQVAALNGAGSEGPKSSSVSAKTTGSSSSTGGSSSTSRGYGWARVMSGDTVAKFAARNGTSEANIRKFNSSAALNRLTVGEWLKTLSTANPTSGYKG